MRSARPPIERFMEKFEEDPATGCWRWTAFVNGSGYGHFDRGPLQRAHRAAWLLLRGAIPDGAHLDHLCHTRDVSCPGGPACLHRRCVNPDHLEPVTHQENQDRGRRARREMCTADLHEMSEVNTGSRRDGRRYCKECHRATNRARAQARRDAVRGAQMSHAVCDGGGQSVIAQVTSTTAQVDMLTMTQHVEVIAVLVRGLATV